MTLIKLLAKNIKIQKGDSYRKRGSGTSGSFASKYTS